jgi:hypothetical protein
MANLPATAAWESGIYQIETTDPVLGGAPNPATGAGMTNIPHLQLDRRTLWLRDYALALQGQLDTLQAQIAMASIGRPVVGPVLVATTANITLSGLQTIDGVSVTAGRRVLVKNQTTAEQNGVYVAGSGAWSRATDFDAGTDIVPGTIVSVTAGTTQEDTLWALSSPNEGDAITIGSTALAFANATALMAPLASPQFTGAPSAPTPAAGSNSTLLATTAFVVNSMPASLAASGWQRLPSGLILQWGNVAGNTGQKVTYSLTFPTGPLVIVPFGFGQGASGAGQVSGYTTNDATGFTPTITSGSWTGSFVAIGR